MSMAWVGGFIGIPVIEYLGEHGTLVVAKHEGDTLHGRDCPVSQAVPKALNV